MKIKQVARFVFMLAIITAVPLVSFATGSFIPGSTSVAEFVDPNYGKVNLAPTNGGVTITNTQATGFAWGNYVGWINFGPFNNNSSGGVSVSCSAGTATLSGYAWGQNTGWINFGPFTGGNTAQQVQIDSSGNLTGYAWAQNAGWLDFTGAKTSFSCSTGGGGGGNGGPTGPSCSLSVSQQQITTPGLPVTLSWAVSSSGSFSFSIPSIGITSSTNGSVVINPNQTTTYNAVVTEATSANTCNATIVVSPLQQTLGCVDPNALNYNHLATVDNGRCVYDPTETYTLEYTDEVLTNQSCSYFDTYLKKGARGIEVAKVQNFLNKYMNANVKVDGVFGETTVAAVKKFQALHATEIIDPWRPFLTKPSGWWYKTTAGTANIIVGCTQKPVFLETPKIEYSFETAAKNLFNKLFNLVKPSSANAL